MKYSEAYSKLVYSNLKSYEKEILSKKLKEIYSEIKGLKNKKKKKDIKKIVHKNSILGRIYHNIRKLSQKDKKNIIEDIEQKEKEHKLKKYDLRASAQRHDLTKRYEKLAAKTSKISNIHEQIELFMEYYRLYSDLSESVISLEEKKIIAEKLKEIYKRLKIYNK
jgi:hypothetical protein